MNEIIKTLTTQRERLDSIKTGLGTLPKSRGTALAFTALEKSRMYIGEICIQLGNENPYEATKTATDAKGIQDAVDTSELVYGTSGNEIIDLNTFRTDLEIELEKLLDVIEKMKSPVGGRNSFVTNCIVSEAYRGLKESRMYLGIRLGELRDIEKGK